MRKVSAQLLLSAFVDAPYPLGGAQASTVAGFQGTAEDAQKSLETFMQRGFYLSLMKILIFMNLPPPLPPGAAVLIDLKTSEILTMASKPNYDLSQLTPLYLRMFIIKSKEEKPGFQSLAPRLCPSFTN